MTPYTRPVIAGNWKMNRGPAAAREFFEVFRSRFAGLRRGTLVFFPPAISFPAAFDAVQGRADLLLGVQNLHWEEKGAFTGEISAEMAADAGARFALVGHSERRHVFGETDEMVAHKGAAAFRAGLAPVVCVGERLEERRAEQVEAVILRQLNAVLARLTAAQVATLLVAYEPVWAIGTGVNATPADASAAHAVLRRRLREVVGPHADSIPILYGGSVNPGNASELLAARDVDGLLVGGASLDPGSFAAIAEAAALA